MNDLQKKKRNEMRKDESIFCFAFSASPLIELFFDQIIGEELFRCFLEFNLLARARLSTSATRFGKISPLGRAFNFIGNFWSCSFIFGKIFNLLRPYFKVLGKCSMLEAANF